MGMRIRPLRDLLLDEARAVLQFGIASEDEASIQRAVEIIDAVEEATDATLMRSVVVFRRETLRLALTVETRGEA